MKKYYRFTLIALVLSVFLSFCLAGVSSATVIDFRSYDPWHGAHDQTSFTYGNVTLSPSPGGSTLWHDTIDGIGVQYDYENDEIEGDEVLEVSFKRDVTLNAIYIADLFHEQIDGQWYYETGQYSTDGGTSWVDFSADDPTYQMDNGEIVLTVGLHNVNSLWFRSPGTSIPGQTHEFAVQGIEMTAAAPEPGTLLLLGSGLAGLYVSRRQLKRR
jgi:hypothetical protein